MRSRWTTPLVLAAVALLVAGAWAPFASAQAITTGRLSGRVVAEADGAALPGAQVLAIHLPTGTRYDTLTRADGRFDILNVRVGGPYEVTVRMDGFVETIRNEVYVALGEEENLQIGLPIEAIEETVTVVGEQSPIINPSATGVTNNVSVQTIEALPVVERSLQEIAKLSPYFAAFGENDEETVVSVAGRNNRYNNIQIDGAVNNDVFGLAATGTPGGQAEAQPISYDAIQELQLLVSPYDVRQGGFSGGGINAITRSGTNAWTGSVYWYNRDEGLVGDGPFDSEIGAFSEDEYGGRVGGPLVRDKAFFFLSGEVAELERPTGFAADGSAPQNFEDPESLAQMREILINQYGFDPGGLSQFVRDTPSDKLFGRIDYNVAENHQLVLRHNWVDATNDIIRPDTRFYDFPSWNYNFDSETNSTVGQLNSVLSNNLFNELRVTNQTIRDKRFGDEPFPAVTVDFGPTEATAGVENFSTANALDQDIIELSNEVNWILGDHQLTLGTANEFMEFENVFIRNSFGNYRFNSLADFERGWASRYEFSFAVTGDPNEPAKFEVQKLGFYAGDRWQVNPTFNLVYGLRADVPYFPDEPALNQDILGTFGFRTDEVADGNLQWSPRVGFNWDISGDGSQQLRGGVGYFAGRPPYVWISNQYGNTGVDFFRFTANVSGPIGPDNHIAFRPDPFDQYTDPAELGAQVSTNEVNLIDPDFEYPSVLRASLGYDRELGFFGLIGTAEILWSEVDQDIHYQNLNLQPTGNTAFDGRPTFTRVDSQIGDVILLTNSGKGDTLNATLKVERPFRNGWYAMAAYAYGESNAVNPGTSSQAISNWRFLPTKGDPNVDVNATSQFEIQDRFIANASYTFDYGTGWGTTLSMFYNAQSGQPYSLIFDGDVNGDRQFGNDLLYVPASCDEVIITNGDCGLLQSLFDAVEGTTPGEIVDRNHARGPWVHRIDLKLAQKIPVARYGMELTLDILNLANLVDSDSGLVEFVRFGTFQAVEFDGIDAATGKPIYALNFDDPDDRFVIDDLRSRWQAKLGIRFNF